MSIRIKNNTPGSLSWDSSASYVAYEDLGPRPLAADCDFIEECPACLSDTPFKLPVVAGETLYLQFNNSDQFNSNIESPAYGWFSSDETDYYIKATLEFANDGVDDLILGSDQEGEIITEAYVGYNNGSFQNLFLSAQRIFEYIQSEGVETDCFRIKLQIYAAETSDDFSTVVYVGSTVPITISTQWNNGDFLAVNGQTYQIVSFNIVLVGTYSNGDVVFNTLTGFYYQLTGGVWVKTTVPTEPTLVSSCYTGWHKFVNCEDTVLFEGRFGSTDCGGKYYGLIDGATNAYRDRWRLEGVFEPTGISTEKEENENGTVVSFKQYENWVFRSLVGMPWKVVQRLGNTISATHVYINSNEYVHFSDITKPNPDGLYWYTTFTVERLACEKTNSCDDIVTFTEIVECDPCDNPVCDPVTILRDGVFYDSANAGETVDVISDCPSGSGETVLVHNSDDSYSEEVDCGTTLELPDTTVNVYVDSVLEDSATFATLSSQTININWV